MKLSSRKNTANRRSDDGMECGISHARESLAHAACAFDVFLCMLSDAC